MDHIQKLILGVAAFITALFLLFTFTLKTNTLGEFKILLWTTIIFFIIFIAAAIWIINSRGNGKPKHPDTLKKNKYYKVIKTPITFFGNEKQVIFLQHKPGKILLYELPNDVPKTKNFENCFVAFHPFRIIDMEKSDKAQKPGSQKEASVKEQGGKGNASGGTVYA
jgi:predicted ferric reductase